MSSTDLLELLCLKLIRNLFVIVSIADKNSDRAHHLAIFVSYFIKQKTKTIFTFRTKY